MSTKIYNGYKLPKMDFKETVEFAQKVKVEFEKIKTKKYHKTFATLLIDSLDNINSGYNTLEKYKKSRDGKHLFDSIFSNTYWDMHDRIKEIKNTRERDPAVDFGAEVLFIPCDDCILSLFYAESRELTKCWESLKEVEFYGYWNNSDKPRNIKVKDWQKRNDDWDKALGGDGYGIPGDYGFVYTLTSPDIRTPQPKDIIKHIPPFTKRLNRVVNDKFSIDYIEDKIKHIPKEEQNWGHMSEHYFFVRDELYAGRFKEEIEKLKLELEPLLHKKITKEILYEPIFKEIKLPEPVLV